MADNLPSIPPEDDPETYIPPREAWFKWQDALGFLGFVLCFAGAEMPLIWRLCCYLLCAICLPISFFSHKGWPLWFRRALSIAAIVFMVVIGFFAWKKEHPISVLTMKAHVLGAYGPTVQSMQIDLDIKNPGDEAIQNLDLNIVIASRRVIKNLSEMPFGNECHFEPVNLFPTAGVTLKGADGESRLAINTNDAAIEFLRDFGSPQWNLKCSRIGGDGSLRLQIGVKGDAEKDTVHIFGTYERIASEGSKVVPVDTLTAVEK